MAIPFLTAGVKGRVEQLACLLDPGVSWRLLPLLTGLLFATGRRTVSSWLRACGLSSDYQDYYYFLSILGRNVQRLAGRLVRIVAEVVLPPGNPILFAIDDTPANDTDRRWKGQACITTRPQDGPARSSSIATVVRLVA